MFNKYTKTGSKKSTSILKMDFKAIPFDLIEEDYQTLLAQEISTALEEKNSLAKAAFERKLKRYEPESEGSREQENDSSPWFKPIESLDKNELTAIQSAINTRVISAFVERFDIKASWAWLGPQLLAHLGKYPLPDLVPATDADLERWEYLNSNRQDFFKLHKPEQFVYKPVDFLKSAVGSDTRERGIYRLITKVARGILLDKQTLPEHLTVCSLVPMYLAAQKKYNNVPFRAWSVEGLSHLVDHNLHEAMTCTYPLGELDAGEVLEIRRVGLTYTSKSAKTPGATLHRNPETYHMLINIKESAIGNLPAYAKAMVTQIWCAHPNNRHPYMVLNPYNWDDMPDPIISSKILESEIVKPAYAGRKLTPVADDDWM